MSLRIKLLSLISICAVAFIAFSLLSWNTLNTVKINGEWYQRIAQEKDLIADILPPPEYIVEAYLVVFQMIEESDDAKVKELVIRSNKLREEYEERHKYWDQSLADGSLKKELIDKSYKPAMDFFSVRDGKIIPAILANDRDGAGQMARTSLKSSYDEHRKAIDNVVKMASDTLQGDEIRVKEIVDSRTILLIGLGLAITCIMLICGFYMNHICSNIIGRVTRVAANLSDSADQLVSASAQVSSSSQQLAEGSSKQAASLEQTSSALEEMASMTRQNADNSQQADAMIGQTTKIVDTANHSMGNLTTSMQEITTASEETAHIIKTIDEIAFQTNLLALNAAVEAARAGEAGAGFAVVADEVRNLAMRAADAAKSTSTLLEGTVRKIRQGSDMVTETNAAFSTVATSITKLGALVAEITAASHEQAQGAEQVNQAIAEIDRVTQQTAANAEESASACRAMNTQAQQMKSHAGELSAIVGG